MLPEIGATELLVIAAVALIVVGPKDLPLLLRKLGQFMAKLRSMANDFRASFDEMARQSELDELRREVDAMRKGQLSDLAGLDAGQAEVTDTFREIDQSMNDMRFPPTPASATEPAASSVEISQAPVAETAAKPKSKPRRKPTVEKGETAPKPAAAKKAPAKPRARKSGTVT